MSVQIILLLAMAPYWLESDLTEIRSSTNYPEIGMHIIHVSLMVAKQPLAHLVHALSQCLRDKEHMLVFFASQTDAENFTSRNKCTFYHSELWEAMNTKAYNLDLWN